MSILRKRAMFRGKVNKASLNISNTRGTSKVGANIMAQEKLKRVMEQRKKGVKGLVRKAASPEAVKRLSRLRQYQLQKAKEAEQKVRRSFSKKSLKGIHPLFEKISTGDIVSVRSSGRGLKRYNGMIIDDNQSILWLRTMDGKKLPLNMRVIDKVTLQRK